MILSRAILFLGEFFQKLLPSLALLLILSRAVLFLGDFFQKLPPNLALLLVLSRVVLFLGESFQNLNLIKNARLLENSFKFVNI